MAFIVLPGADASGNGNDWTANNINNTDSTATTYDIMTDVPTLTDEDTANFAVINPLNSSTTTVPTTSNANLRIVGTVSAYQGMYMSMAIPSTGKWYFEYTYETKQGSGGNQQTLITPSPSLSGSGAISDSTTLYGLYANSNYQYGSTGQTDLGIAAVAGNTQMVAYDSDTGKLWWGYNGTWFLSGNPSAGTSPLATQTASIEKYIANVTYGTGGTTVYNFGQRPFAYTPPTGYKKLNTFNLPDSSIVKGNEYMDATLWTGNTPSSQTITNASGFQPDFVWVKGRSGGYSNSLYDSVRGVRNTLSSNSTNAENLESAGYSLTAFNSNGFSVGIDNVGIGSVNASGSTYVGWQWKAGGTAVSNTDGTITSSVSANPTAGFSVVTYTGTGSAATVGHGLGVAPKMVITKKRNGTSNWGFWITGFTGLQYMEMDTTGAILSAASVWNSTTPASTVFSVGSATFTNNSGGTYVAYCFAEVEGYSKFGSYTGNGSADGTFVYTGFRPAYLMIKCTDTGGTTWWIEDSARDTYNPQSKILVANTSAAEATLAAIDTLSNGFKFRHPSADVNGSGKNYIYMAFAENPFKNSLAR
jgi:hypothetical protein